MRGLTAAFGEYAKLTKKVADEVLTSVNAISDPEYLAYAIIPHLNLGVAERQELLCGGQRVPVIEAHDEGVDHGDADPQQVSAVDQFPAQNEYGIYDIIGNVREWTLSLWGESPAAPSPLLKVLTITTRVIPSNKPYSLIFTTIV